MAETELRVILKAKDLAEHTLRITSNCNRYLKKYRFSLMDKMAELIKQRKMTEEKFYEKYNAWKNHALHGNCIKLCHSIDLYVKGLLESEG